VLQVLVLYFISREPQEDRRIPSVPQAPKCSEQLAHTLRLSDKGRNPHMAIVAKYKKKVPLWATNDSSK